MSRNALHTADSPKLMHFLRNFSVSARFAWLIRVNLRNMPIVFAPALPLC